MTEVPPTAPTTISARRLFADDEFDRLQCPVCDCPNIHGGQPRVRGDSVSIGYTCEGGCLFELSLTHSKGYEYLSITSHGKELWVTHPEAFDVEDDPHGPVLAASSRYRNPPRPGMTRAQQEWHIRRLEGDPA